MFILCNEELSLPHFSDENLKKSSPETEMLGYQRTCPENQLSRAHKGSQRPKQQSQRLPWVFTWSSAYMLWLFRTEFCGTPNSGNRSYFWLFHLFLEPFPFYLVALSGLDIRICVWSYCIVSYLISVWLISLGGLFFSKRKWRRNGSEG